MQNHMCNMINFLKNILFVDIKHDQNYTKMTKCFEVYNYGYVQFFTLVFVLYDQRESWNFNFVSFLKGLPN